MQIDNEIVELVNQFSGFKREIMRMEKLLKSQRKAAKQVQTRILSWMDSHDLKELAVSPSLSCSIEVRDKKVGLSAAQKKEKLEEWIMAKRLASWDDYNEYLLYCSRQQKVEKVRVLELKSTGEPPLKKMRKVEQIEQVKEIEQVD